eukprot:scaffold187218_cov74-Cyclotella_meneghiniana.AAC.1
MKSQSAEAQVFRLSADDDIAPIALSPWLTGVFVSESSSQKFRQRAVRQAASSQNLKVTCK